MFASLICRMEVITHLFPRVIIKIIQGNVCKMLSGVWHLISHTVHTEKGEKFINHLHISKLFPKFMERINRSKI